MSSKIPPKLIGKKPTTLAGGVRRKVTKKITNSKVNIITLEKNIAPYGAGLISNVTSVKFFADDREKQLQFNFPKVKTAEKTHLTVLYGKAVQMPEPPSDIMLKEMESSKLEKDYERKINKLERRLSHSLSDKLTLLDNYKHVSLIGINIGKMEFKISVPKIYKISGEDIYIIWGVIERVNNNIIHTGELPSVLDDVIENENEKSDDSAYDENTIQLIMDETGLTKSEAITLLSKYNGDMVEAVMSIDTELVMAETGISKDKAIELLNKNEGDAVKAIEESGFTEQPTIYGN